jgi:hypothetical protein
VATSSSSSASAKKVAKLAQRGKGKKVRFQGGSLFPIAVLVVVALGLLTIVYARQSRPDPGSRPPQVGDHWHAAYGMYVCDGWLPKLAGTKEEKITDPQTGNQVFADADFQATGIHSHGDGVIHYHPSTTKAVGNRAKLSVFLDVYKVKLSTNELTLSADQGGATYKVGDYKCKGKDVQIEVVKWESYDDTGDGQTYITDLTNIPIDGNGMVFTIAVVPKGTKIVMPPWAKDLPSLGAADSATGDSTTTLVAGTTDTASTGSTTAPTGTTTGGAPTTTGG